MLMTLSILVVQAVSLHLVFVGIERLWRPGPAPDLSHLDAETRRKRAESTNRLGTALCVAGWPFFTVGWYLLFRRIEAESAPGVPGTLFVIRPSAGPGFAAPLIAGYALAGGCGLGLLWLIRRRTFREDLAVGDRHFGFNIRRFCYFSVVWCVPLCIDWEYAWINTWTAFTGEEVVVRGFLADRAVPHRIADVAEILGVRDYRETPGAIFPKPSYKIAFKDGTSWTTAQGGHFPLPDDRAAIKHVARRSGRPIRWVAAID